MISSGTNTSILVPYQLPEFIRDNPDYSNFVLFLQSYYEWMEQNGNVTDVSKNLLNYADIDSTTEQFAQYFYNDFLSYFPTEILANKNEVVKIAKQLYQAKGTPASFQFFFRVLYNSDVDFFYTKDAVLKASAGKWYISKSLRLDTLDRNFLEIKNLRVFGETSKSIATVENSLISTNKTEVFISNIERLFQSGEIIRVVDNSNQDIYFLNEKIVPTGTPGAEILRAKLVGQISQINISSNDTLRGLLYQGANTSVNYPGDPVVVYGGLNSNTTNPIGATAYINTTTKGSIKNIYIANTNGTLLGGFGYSIEDSTQPQYGQINILNGGGAIANIAGVNTSIVYVGNSYYNPVSTISYVPTDRIGSKTGAIPSSANAQYLFDTANGFILHDGVSLGLAFANDKIYTSNSGVSYYFANLSSANATTTLANGLSFINSFLGYPISSVVVENQGGGLTSTPIITAQSLYKTQDGVATSDLGTLGILGPIQINNPGLGYRVNDTIVISGGSGYGAYANVITVAANGAITNVAYVYSTTGPRYPLGGMGYRLSALPTLTVSSANTQAANASLSIAGIVGQGAQFTSSLDRVGSITTINITNYGEDYVSQPNVSFKVQDIIVTNVRLGSLPQQGDIIYQGANVNTSTYLARVDSITPLQLNANTLQDIYSLRVYNYNATPNIAFPLNSNNYSISITNSYASTILSEYGGINSTRYVNGVITYGDGTATGNATFLNGLTLGAGQYLDTSGQPSSFDVLQSPNYNNYTYQITLEKEIAKYRSALLNLLHPTGMKVIGRFAMKSNGSMLSTTVDALQTGYNLYDSTKTNNSTVTVSSGGDFTQLSSNVISFNYLGDGVNLANIIFSNSSIRFVTSNGLQVFSEVNSINPSSNTVTLKNNVWITFVNVASGIGTSGGNTINISNVYTSSYNLYNGGVYSYPNTPLQDIIHTGDYIKVNNMVKLVTVINYNTNVITVNSNFTYAATGNISLNRVLVGSAQNTQIFGPLGTQYVPQLVDELTNTILTEDGNAILIN